MSLMCDCKNCGGTDEFAMCENAAMDAWVEAHRPRPFFLSPIFAVLLVIGGLCLWLG